MQKNEFNCSISRDSAPYGSTCEWCNKLAEQRLLAIGGNHHNAEGLFCHSCGKQFFQAVVYLAPATRQ